jgi:hypothetical protein
LYDRDANNAADNRLWKHTNRGSSMTVGFRWQHVLPEDGGLTPTHVGALCIQLCVNIRVHLVVVIYLTMLIKTMQ